MTEPGEILKLNLEREKRIKELKESNPRQFEREISELVNKVRKGYRTLVVSHTAFLYGESRQSKNGPMIDRDFRDVTGLLWKTCFYKQIVEFRGSLRKHANQLDALGQQVREQPSVEEFRIREQQERIYIARLTQAFLSFLSDSIAFYQKMIAELEDQARQMLRVHDVALREVRWLVLSVHRCLLYLGDLARYKEMYVDKEQKEFLESLRYYERAALIDPSSGNAQNQLAVLATYSDAECVAVYHYCRSILSLNPFSGGFENLSLLFAKNAVSMRTLMAQHDKPKYNPLARGLGSTGKSKKASVPPLKHFLTQFVHLHGQLFTFTTHMHQSYADSVHSQSQSQSQRDSSNAGEVNWTRALNNSSQASHGSSRREEMLTSAELVTHFNNQLHALLDDYMEQFSANTLTDALLVRLLAICLFSIHYAVSKDANFLAYTDPHASTNNKSNKSGYAYMSSEWMRHYLEVSSAQPRSVSESLALQLLYGIVSRTATRVAEMVTAHERSSRAALNRALPMLSVFADWAQLHTHYATTTTSITTTATTLTTSVKANIATTTAVITTTTIKLHKQAPTRANQTLDDVAPPSMFADAPELATTQTTTAAAAWDESAYSADPALLRTEARARSGMRTAVASLRAVLDTDLRANEHYQEFSTSANKRSAGAGAGVVGTSKITSKSGSKSEAAEPVQQFLREHIELRGFLPLASHIETYFEHFDPFCRALNVMSESWSRLHRQTSVLNFIDAAFVTTDVNGGSAADAHMAAGATTKTASSAKNKKAKGKEPSASIREHAQQNGRKPTMENATEDYLEPSEADFPELPRLTPRAPSHHTNQDSNGNSGGSSRHGPPAMPSHIDRSFLQQSGTGTQHSDVEAPNDLPGEPEHVFENMSETECEDDLLDDNVVFQSAFLRAYPSNEAFVTERNEWTSPTNGLLYPPSHAGSSSRLDSLLFQDQRSTPSNRDPYAPGAPTGVQGGLGLDLGLDLDLDLSRLVQDSHDQQHQGLNPFSSAAFSHADTNAQSHGGGGSQDKLSTLFGTDFWSDTPSLLPALPQPHASFGHAFNTAFDPLSTGTLGMNAGFGALNHGSVSVGGLGGADSWSFGQLNASHHALPPQSAPIPAAQPAYYFPPSAAGGSGGLSSETTGWSPSGLNPHTLLPPPPPLLLHQSQQGFGSVPAAAAASAGATGPAGAPPPGLQRHKVSAPPPGLG